MAAPTPNNINLSDFEINLFNENLGKLISFLMKISISVSKTHPEKNKELEEFNISHNKYSSLLKLTKPELLWKQHGVLFLEHYNQIKSDLLLTDEPLKNPRWLIDKPFTLIQKKNGLETGVRLYISDMFRISSILAQELEDLWVKNPNSPNVDFEPMNYPTALIFYLLKIFKSLPLYKKEKNGLTRLANDAAEILGMEDESLGNLPSMVTGLFEGVSGMFGTGKEIDSAKIGKIMKRIVNSEETREIMKEVSGAIGVETQGEIPSGEEMTRTISEVMNGSQTKEMIEQLKNGFDPNDPNATISNVMNNILPNLNLNNFVNPSSKSPNPPSNLPSNSLPPSNLPSNPLPPSNSPQQVQNVTNSSSNDDDLDEIPVKSK